MNFIARLPDDPITAKPMHYQLISPGEFKLRSVGWDLMDDGGTPGKGDIVWRRP